MADAASAYLTSLSAMRSTCIQPAWARPVVSTTLVSRFDNCSSNSSSGSRSCYAGVLTITQCDRRQRARTELSEPVIIDLADPDVDGGHHGAELGGATGRERVGPAV